MKKLIPLLLCFVLALSGCAAKHSSDGAQTTAEGAGFGAVIGAVLGGAVAIATGDAKWVAIGAGAGAVVGTGVGLYVAKKKEEYATREAWLDDSIDKALAANKASAEYNAKLKADLEQLDAQSKQLAAAYKSQTAKASDMKKMQQAIAEQQKSANSYIAEMEQVVAAQKAVVADARTEKREREAAIIEQEIIKLELQIAQTKEEVNKLATSSSSRISI